MLILGKTLGSVQMYAFIPFSRISTPLLVHTNQSNRSLTSLTVVNRLNNGDFDDDDNNNHNGDLDDDDDGGDDSDQSFQMNTMASNTWKSSFSQFAIGSPNLLFDIANSCTAVRTSKSLSQLCHLFGHSINDFIVQNDESNHIIELSPGIRYNINTSIFPPNGHELILPSYLFTGLLPEYILLHFSFVLSFNDHIIRAYPHGHKFVFDRFTSRGNTPTPINRSVNIEDNFMLFISLIELPSLLSSNPTKSTSSLENILNSLHSSLSTHSALVYRLPLSQQTGLPDPFSTPSLLINPTNAVSSQIFGSSGNKHNSTKGSSNIQRLFNLLTRIEDSSHILTWAEAQKSKRDDKINNIQTLNISEYIFHNNDTNTLFTLPQSYNDLFILDSQDNKPILTTGCAPNNQKTNPNEKAQNYLSLTEIQLPRLLLTFICKYDSTGTLRLYLKNQPDLFISDIRPTQATFRSLFSGIPHSILLQNNKNDFFVLVPNHPVCHNTITRSFPLDTTLMLQRNDHEWIQVCTNRFYLYQIHPSLTSFYLFSTTIGGSSGSSTDLNASLGSLFYLFTLKFLNRDYVGAREIIDKCLTDQHLLDNQVRYMYKNIQVTLDDKHPDASALRLYLTTLFEPYSPPMWQYGRVEKGKGNEAGAGYDFCAEYIDFLPRLHHVSEACRLDFDREMDILFFANKKLQNHFPLLQRRFFLASTIVFYRNVKTNGHIYELSTNLLPHCTEMSKNLPGIVMCYGGQSRNNELLDGIGDNDDGHKIDQIGNDKENNDEQNQNLLQVSDFYDEKILKKKFNITKPVHYQILPPTMSNSLEWGLQSVPHTTTPLGLKIGFDPHDIKNVTPKLTKKIDQNEPMKPESQVNTIHFIIDESHPALARFVEFAYHDIIDIVNNTPISEVYSKLEKKCDENNKKRQIQDQASFPSLIPRSQDDIIFKHSKSVLNPSYIHAVNQSMLTNEPLKLLSPIERQTLRGTAFEPTAVPIRTEIVYNLTQYTQGSEFLHTYGARLTSQFCTQLWRDPEVVPWKGVGIYNRPKQSHLRGARLVWILNKILTDTFDGSTHRLGYYLLLDTLMGSRSIDQGWNDEQKREEYKEIVKIEKEKQLKEFLLLNGVDNIDINTNDNINTSLPLPASPASSASPSSPTLSSATTTTPQKKNTPKFTYVRNPKLQLSLYTETQRKKLLLSAPSQQPQIHTLTSTVGWNFAMLCSQFLYMRSTNMNSERRFNINSLPLILFQVLKELGLIANILHNKMLVSKQTALTFSSALAASLQAPKQTVTEVDESGEKSDEKADNTEKSESIEKTEEQSEQTEKPEKLGKPEETTEKDDENDDKTTTTPADPSPSTKIKPYISGTSYDELPPTTVQNLFDGLPSLNSLYLPFNRYGPQIAQTKPLHKPYSVFFPFLINVGNFLRTYVSSGLHALAWNYDYAHIKTTSNIIPAPDLVKNVTGISRASIAAVIPRVRPERDRNLSSRYIDTYIFNDKTSLPVYIHGSTPPLENNTVDNKPALLNGNNDVNSIVPDVLKSSSMQELEILGILPLYDAASQYIRTKKRPEQTKDIEQNSPTTISNLLTTLKEHPLLQSQYAHNNLDRLITDNDLYQTTQAATLHHSSSLSVLINSTIQSQTPPKPQDLIPVIHDLDKLLHNIIAYIPNDRQFCTTTLQWILDQVNRVDLVSKADLDNAFLQIPRESLLRLSKQTKSLSTGVLPMVYASGIVPTDEKTMLGSSQIPQSIINILTSTQFILPDHIDPTNAEHYIRNITMENILSSGLANDVMKPFYNLMDQFYSNYYSKNAVIFDLKTRPFGTTIEDYPETISITEQTRLLRLPPPSLDVLLFVPQEVNYNVDKNLTSKDKKRENVAKQPTPSPLRMELPKGYAAETFNTLLTMYMVRKDPLGKVSGDNNNNNHDDDDDDGSQIVKKPQNNRFSLVDYTKQQITRHGDTNNAKREILYEHYEYFHDKERQYIAGNISELQKELSLIQGSFKMLKKQLKLVSTAIKTPERLKSDDISQLYLLNSMVTVSEPSNQESKKDIQHDEDNLENKSQKPFQFFIMPTELDSVAYKRQYKWLFKVYTNLKSQFKIAKQKSKLLSTEFLEMVQIFRSRIQQQHFIQYRILDVFKNNIIEQLTELYRFASIRPWLELNQLSRRLFI
jgi:hypothetical protein